MSETPITMGQMFDVVSIFDRQEQAELSLPEMLEQVLTLITEYIPDQFSSQVYRWNGSAFSLWASTRPESLNRENNADNPLIFVEALQRFAPMAEDTRWVVPLFSQKHPLGVLEIVRRQPAAVPVPDWLRLVGSHLGAVLGNRLMQDFVQRQAKTAAELTTCTTIVEMAAAVGRNMLDTGQFVAIGMADFGEAKAFDGFKVVATANRQQAFSTAEVFEGVPGALDIFDKSLADGTPVLITDRDNPALVHPSLAGWLSRFKVRSLYILPLRSMGDVFGFMTINSVTGPLNLAPFEYQGYQNLAGQLATAISTAQFRARSNQDAERLQYITEFSQALQSTLNKTEIFDIALTTGGKVLQQDYMSIIMYDSNRGRLHVVARFEDGAKVIDLLAHPLEMPVENTPAGQVWETRKLLIVSDLSQESILRHPFRDDLRSLLTAPVLARGLALGMVEVGSFTPNAYDENDIAVFQQMVTQLSVTIENAEAYAQSQEMAKNKGLASQIAAHLQQQTDIESILNVTMTELGKALGAKQGRIRMGTDYIGDSQP